jgi:type IV secretory pathway VirJ component
MRLEVRRRVRVPVGWLTQASRHADEPKLLNAWRPGIKIRPQNLRTPVVAVCLLAAALSACGPISTPFQAGRFGEARLFEAAGAPRGIVFFFGASGGWSEADDAAASRLVSAGAIAIGIDLPQYRRHLADSLEPCLYLVPDVEKVSRQVQRREAFGRYMTPILAGVGDGGGIAEAVLAQSPPSTLAGAVAVDPKKVEMPRPICSQPPTTAGLPAKGAAGFRLLAFSGHSPTGGKPQVESSTIEIQPLPAAATREESLAELVVRKLSAVSSSNGLTGIDDLPLVELPPATLGAPLVIILSGDGGWRDIDSGIAGSLQQRGLAVLGWDSLHYFWRAKTPDELGRDLARAIAFYCDNWRAPKVALVGYSFGADVIPFAVNHLPPDLRRRIVQISLLAFSTKADFEIHVSGWLGAGPSDAARATGPEMAWIDPHLVQCFYGTEETESGCPALVAIGAEVVKTGGGHHLGGDYAALAARIADGLARRSRAVTVPTTSPN